MRHTELWEAGPGTMQMQRKVAHPHPPPGKHSSALKQCTARPRSLWQTHTEREFVKKYSRGLEWLTGVIWGQW